MSLWQLCAAPGDNLSASTSTHHLFTSSGEQTALSTIAILPLGFIFQTLKDNFVPHHNSCPSHLMMSLDGRWSFLPDLAPRRAWVNAHLCGEGMVQNHHSGRARGTCTNYSQAQTPRGRGNKPKVDEDRVDDYHGCFSHSC